MADLRTKIAALAAEFAEKIVEAIASGTLQDISSLTSGRVPARSIAPASRPAPVPRTGTSAAAPRLRPVKKGARRGAAEFEQISNAIVTLLKKHSEGLRSEDLQKALGLARKDLPRPLGFALEKNLIRKTGNKRATRYFAR